MDQQKIDQNMIKLIDLHVVSKFEVIWINISKDITNFFKWPIFGAFWPKKYFLTQKIKINQNMIKLADLHFVSKFEVIWIDISKHITIF